MDQWLAQHEEELLRHTAALLKINSVKAEPRPGAPFGAGNRACLDYALDLCASLGFRVKNNDGYYGYAELGEGDPLLGILVHLDVVPAGEDWTYPPFEARVMDGKLFGRGAVDDKAPAVAAIYAAKAAYEKGIHGRVRIIFGCDEESGWGCMDRYTACEQAPDMAFSPDADFPLINTEKRILHIQLTKQGSFPFTLQGGQRANVVPDSATATVTDEGLADLLRLNGCEEESGVFRFSGISAHASLAETGVNALFKPLRLLSEAAGESGEVCALLCERLADQPHGEGMDLDLSDEQSGRLTVNLGILHIDHTSCSLTLDFRVPVTVPADVVPDKVKECFPGFTAEIISHQPAHHVPADSPLVQTLLAAYREVTGDMTPPRAIGGGTYARAFANAVAFGPNFPGGPELAHQKDEYITLADLMRSARIYARAVAKLLI